MNKRTLYKHKKFIDKLLDRKGVTDVVMRETITIESVGLIEKKYHPEFRYQSYCGAIVLSSIAKHYLIDFKKKEEKLRYEHVR